MWLHLPEVIDIRIPLNKSQNPIFSSLTQIDCFLIIPYTQTTWVGETIQSNRFNDQVFKICHQQWSFAVINCSFTKRTRIGEKYCIFFIWTLSYYLCILLNEVLTMAFPHTLRWIRSALNCSPRNCASKCFILPYRLCRKHYCFYHKPLKRATQGCWILSAQILTMH